MLTLLLAFSCLGVPAPREISIFGDPLFVNDRRVSDDEIKLALIYGPCRQALELRKTELLIEDEIARQAVAGTTIGSLRARSAVSDKQFEAAYQLEVDEFKRAYPTSDIGSEICRAFRSVDWYRDYVRQQMRFDRVFLPENPADWPKVTLDAVRADPAVRGLLLPNGQQSYQEQRAAGGPLLLEYLRQIVREPLIDRMGFKTQPDIDDPRFALWADTNGDGKPEFAVTIGELWDKVSDTVTDTEVHEAKQWCITSRATRDRLVRGGGLLSRKEQQDALVDLASGLGGMYTLEQLATRTFSFPSVESFSEYYGLKRAFERSIAPKLAEGTTGELAPALAEHLPRANLALGLGMVDCEVLLVSAMDIPRFRWKKDGWFEARRKAQRLREEYDKDPTPKCWSRLLDAHSEYWDPPPNERASAGSSDVIRKHNGRFGTRYLQELMQCVGESAYTEWVTGECITDRTFFDQPENTVAGPFRGPLGWYLTRVTHRAPPSHPLKLDNPNHRQALKDDYLRSAFIQYSKEAVARANVRGFQPL
jgi:hypothetical protein